MTTALTRRGFLRRVTISTAALAGATGGGLLSTAARADTAREAHEPPLYAFPFLGDLHYDKLEHHDLDWVQQKMPKDLSQIHGYVRTTEQYTPRLLAEVREQIKASAAPVPFAIQVGDLVEGLCGSFDLQSKQMNDATAAVDSASWGVPCLMVKGNHDITGPGAPQAFDQVLLPWMSKQAGQDLHTASYFRRQGDDLFVCFDAYKPDLDWLSATLGKNKARLVFFVIHMPVVPYNARADWTIFHTKADAARRERLLALLGKYRAIVLSGHLHKYSLLSRRTDAGPFVQLAVCSVLRHEHETPRQVLENINAYSPDLVKLEPEHAPATSDARREMLKAEKPFIERYEYCDVPGYSMVKVYRDRVDVDVYVGLGEDNWRTRGLSPAPDAKA
ncbi:MAG TPA: metallophosphoesterase [Tepidisphaeraceae bacterium]|jgi:hypothetical protein